MYTIQKVVSHQHDLKNKSLKLSDIEISLSDKKILYIQNLMNTNAKRNAGKLAEFKSSKNKFRKFVNSIFNNANTFIDETKKIMSDLIKVETLGQSSSGNYLFILYHFKETEFYLNNDGKSESTNIDERRFALLKFEFQDSRHIRYKEIKGMVVSDIHIESNNGLPYENERVKKAVFVNNFKENKLNYELRVVDKESPNVAHFFTENILECKYKVRPQNYLPALRNETLEYITTLKEENVLTEEQGKIAVNNFYEQAQFGNIIDQTNFGERIFGGFIEDEELLEDCNKRYLDRLHKKGLTYNRFEINETDINSLYKNQIITFGNKSYLRFSSDDEDQGYIKIPPNKERINDSDDLKYVIRILLDQNPRELIRKNVR